MDREEQCNMSKLLWSLTERRKWVHVCPGTSRDDYADVSQLFYLELEGRKFFESSQDMGGGQNGVLEWLLQFSKCLEKYQIYNFFSMILETDRTISGAAAFNNLQLIPSVHNNFS